MTQPGSVVAHRTSVLAEAEMVLDLLHGAGIAARLIRPQGTIAGAALNLYETRIEVPAESAARAAELLAELQVLGSSEEMDRAAGAPEADDAAGGADRDADAHGDAPASPLRRRRRLIAIGVGLVCPGSSHLYVHRPWTMLVLGTGFVAALVVRAVAARDPALVQAAFVTMLAVVAVDIAGGLRALPAANRGVGSSRARQIARGLALLGAAIAVAAAVTAVADAPRRARARVLARFRATCAVGSIGLENGTEQSRSVVLQSVALFPLPSRAADRPFGLPVRNARLTLDPNARDMVAFDLPDWLRAACAGMSPPSSTFAAPPDLGRVFEVADSAGPPVTGCGLWFTVMIEPDTSRGLERLEAFGVCHPQWQNRAWSAAGTLTEAPK